MKGENKSLRHRKPKKALACSRRQVAGNKASVGSWLSCRSKTELRSGRTRSRGQASIEYLVVLAVAVIISVVGVGVLTGFIKVGSLTQYVQKSKVYWHSTDIAIMDHEVGSGYSTFVFQNNKPVQIKINTIRFTDTAAQEVSVTQTLLPGTTYKYTSFDLTCDSESYSYAIEFDYDNLEHDLDHKKFKGVERLVGQCTTTSCLGIPMWANGATGTHSDYAYEVAVDSSNNVYVSGSTQGTIDFGGGVTLPSDTGYGIFLVKYDSNGNPQWAKGATGSSSDYAYAVNTDSAGNVYVGGRTMGGLDFGSGVTVASLGMFLAKYDSSGNIQWAKGATGDQYDAVFGIAVGPSGDIYLGGRQEVGMDLGSGIVLADEGNYGSFIAKYDSNGNPQWIHAPSGGIENVQAITVDDDGNAYVVGDHSAGLDFGGGITVADESSTGSFLAKYDRNGNPKWAVGPTGSSYEYAKSVSITPDGKVLWAGYYAGDMDFGTNQLANVAGNGLFLANYDSSGNELWVKGASGSSDVEPNDMDVDSLGNIYLTGEMSLTADFGNGVTLPDETSSSSFIVKYDSSGKAVWAKGPTGSGQEIGNGVAVDSLGNIHVAGDHVSGIEFGNGKTVADSTWDDMFVVKYS